MFLAKNNKKSQDIINLLFFLLPLVFLGGGIGFQIARLMIAGGFAIVLITNRVKVKKHDVLYLIFFIIYAYFIIRSHRNGIVTSIVILYMSYLWFYCNKIPFEIKRGGVDKIFQGFLFAGLVGFAYMGLMNQFVVGGKYTENELNISNLTVPLFLSLYVIHGAIRTWQTRKHFILCILFYLLLFLIIVFLEKRGPIIFCVFAIFFALKAWTPKLKKILLILLFLYPFYGLLLMELIVDNYDQTFGLVFERSDDFEDVDNNPRIVRLYAAEQFISDFRLVDLVGYHKQLILTKRDDDIAHNHFHNAFLQLYYERGLLSVVIISLLLYRYNLSGKKNSLVSKTNYAVIFFLLLVGTNESILMSGTHGELFFILMLLFSKPLNDSEKTI